MNLFFICLATTQTILPKDSIQGDISDSVASTPTKFYELEGVDVTADKPDARYEGNALIVNVADDPRYKAMPVTNMLDVMPGVGLDKETGVQVFQKPASLYIDGSLQQGMTGEMLYKILSSYPASFVEEIEINNSSNGQHGSAPGSSYINIITKVTFYDGLFLSTEANVAHFPHNNYGGGGKKSFLYSKGRFSMSSSFSYDHECDGVNQDLHRKIANTVNLKQFSTSSNRSNSYTGSFNFIWRLPRNHKLSINIDAYDEFTHKSNLQSISILAPQVTRYKSKISSRENPDMWSAAISFLSDPSRNTSLFINYSAMFGGWRSLDNTFEHDGIYDDVNYDSRMLGTIHDFSGKIDWQLTQDQMLQLRYNSNFATMVDSTSYDANHSIYDNHMRAREWNNDLSLIHNYTFTKQWSVQTSIGAHNTGYKYTQGHKSVHNNGRILFKPSVDVRFVTPSNNYIVDLIGLINESRPKYQYQLSSIRFTDDISAQQGNPEIETSKTRFIGLQQTFRKKYFLQMAFAKVINEFGAIYSFNDGIKMLNYNNFADLSVTTISVDLPFIFFKGKLSGKISGLTGYVKMNNLKNGYFVSADRPTYYWNNKYNLNIIYLLTKSVSIQTKTVFQDKINGHQYDRSSAIYINSGLYGQSRNERWKFSIEYNNILDSKKIDYNIYFQTSAESISYHTLDSSLKFSIAYKFEYGKKQKQIDHNTADFSRFQ